MLHNNVDQCLITTTRLLQLFKGKGVTHTITHIKIPRKTYTQRLFRIPPNNYKKSSSRQNMYIFSFVKTFSIFYDECVGQKCTSKFIHLPDEFCCIQLFVVFLAPIPAQLFVMNIRKPS